MCSTIVFTIVTRSSKCFLKIIQQIFTSFIVCGKEFLVLDVPPSFMLIFKNICTWSNVIYRTTTTNLFFRLKGFCCDKKVVFIFSIIFSLCNLMFTSFLEVFSFSSSKSSSQYLPLCSFTLARTC